LNLIIPANSKSEYRRNAVEGAAGLANAKQARITEQGMIKTERFAHSRFPDFFPLNIW
jgi:hypothetical protein